MNKVKAIVYEDIPANRLIMLHGAGNDPDLDDNKIYLKPAGKGINPDMVSHRDLKTGEEITVTIKGSSVWRVELSEDTRPGTLVSCDGDGKIKTTIVGEHASYVGYSLEGGKKGDSIHFARKTGSVDSISGTDMEGMTDNGKEI